MTERTPYQEGIIRRYYKNRQDLSFQKIEELVADIYLADNDRARLRLWKRVEKALVNMKVPPGAIEHIISKRDPETLAQNLKDWWKELPREKQDPG